jgi:hypothetical protein
MGTQATQATSTRLAIHDFDFVHGRWQVRHRRLKERLVGSTKWDEFDGTSHNWPTLDGAGTVDDNFLELAGRHVPGDVDPGLRPGDEPVGDLVAGLPVPARAARPAGRRRFR